jgi:hypothetical protein
MGAAVTAQEATTSTSRAVVEVAAAPGASAYRERTTREEREGRTVERSVVEASSINGGTRVLSEVVDDTARTSPGTTQRTRQQFVTDTNGRSRLVATTQEQRIERVEGGHVIVRDLSEPDVNGRSRATRREREETVAVGGGVFSTETEVSEPVGGGADFLATARTERRERRDGDVVLEQDTTTYANPTGRGSWEATERRVLSRQVDGAGSRGVETVYRSNDAGELVVSDRIVSREWTRGGTEYRTQDVFSTEIPNNGRSAEPRLYQQVEERRTNKPSGAWTTTRTTREPRGGQMRVVEQVVERARPDGRGGTVVDREVLRLDINGRLETTETSQTRESGAGR